MKTLVLLVLSLVGLTTAVFAQSPDMKMTTPIPESISTPAKVQTSIGSLKFFDGVPTAKTTEKVYDYLDRARAVEVFLNAMPVVSMYQAICVSPNLLSTTPGVGTSYLTAFRDKVGAYLLGDKNYRLRVPANPPVKRFWAVTAYDALSRSLLDSGGNITVSSLGDPEVNADGSVDVYFGPTPPKAGTKNWIKTDPAKGFFVVFRFYGPEEGYIEKTWVLNDFELMD